MFKETLNIACIRTVGIFWFSLLWAPQGFYGMQKEVKNIKGMIGRQIAETADKPFRDSHFDYVVRHWK